MKILQINTFHNKAPGSIMFSIHKYLLDNNHDSYVIWGRGRDGNNKDEFRIGSTIDNAYHLMMARVFDRSGFYSKRNTKSIITRIERIKPDIIHLHNVHGYYLDIRLLFEFLDNNNQKVIWTLHDCWPLTGHCAYFEQVQCQKWETGCFKCPQKHTYPKAMLLDNSKKNWNEKRALFSKLGIVFVTPSKWLKNLVERSFIQEPNVKVINNGIDTSIFSKKTIHEDGKMRILGVASEWSERKGFKDFLKLDKVMRENYEFDYEIVIVGLEEKKSINLPNSFTCIERTDDVRGLVKLYQSADVFFNPTYEDNYPTTNLEAISCGTTVITYETGGSPETIEGGGGFVTKKGDICSVANIINEISKDGVRLDRSRHKNIDKMCMVSEYLDLYLQMMG